VGVRLKVTLPLWIFSEIYVLIELTCGVFEKYILFYQGFRPKPWLTFCLNTKSKQKIPHPSASWRTPSPMGEGKRKKVFGYARFTRKTYAQLAETVQTRSFVAQTGQFQTPTSLVFRFTGRGHSWANSAWLNIFY